MINSIEACLTRREQAMKLVKYLEDRAKFTKLKHKEAVKAAKRGKK